MTEQEIIEIANQASKEWLKEFPTPEETAHQVPKRFLEIFAKLVAEKERASNHAYIYELERDLEVAQDKINDCLVCLNFNPLEAAQDKIKGCLGILNYNPRGKK